MPKFSKRFYESMDRSIAWMSAPHLRAYASHKDSVDGEKDWPHKIEECVGLRFAAAVVILSDYCRHGKIKKAKAEDILYRLDEAYKLYHCCIQPEQWKDEALAKLAEIVKEIPVLL